MGAGCRAKGGEIFLTTFTAQPPNPYASSLVEDWVVRSGISDAHGTLHEDDVLGLPHLNHGPESEVGEVSAGQGERGGRRVGWEIEVGHWTILISNLRRVDKNIKSSMSQREVHE